MRIVLTLLILSSLMVAGCSRPSDSFILHDRENAVRSAEVQICKKTWPLDRRGQIFVARVPIDCDGEGRLVVELRTGGNTSCKIGYVTPGLELIWDFFVEGGKCQHS